MPTVKARERETVGTDKNVRKIIEAERKRQFEGLEMIASENYTSAEVLNACGSVLTNKYAEGFPGHRYYGGCQEIDRAETLAIERLKKLFNCKFANVQPHCGSAANMATYFALINLGDKILGQSMDSGGHLTHGSPASFSGKIYDAYSYGINRKTELLEYDEIRQIAKKVKPKLIMCGYSAYSRTINFRKFRQIADEVGAYLVADIAHIAGLIAAGFHPSPVGVAHVVTSTTHKTLRGPRGGIIMTNDEEIATRINKAIFPGLQGGPLEHIIAAKAVAFGEALKPSFKSYIKRLLDNMKVFAEELEARGFRLVSGGTDNHLVLIDLRNLNLTGVQFETALADAGISVNKNAIPDEPLSLVITSGVRVGAAALTTRGMGKREMKKIAQIFEQVAKNPNNKSQLKGIKEEVRKMAIKFPVPGIN
jgi:glycine hydroxymethyltransferase